MGSGPETSFGVALLQPIINNQTQNYATGTHFARAHPTMYSICQVY